ncbi:hypothetical protein [Humibacter sp.]|uniref:hypothetical protein n=1 Tax=Humibacter sp. TaxID=1940291 RepID=UPI003F80D203
MAFTDFFRPKVAQRNGIQPVLAHTQLIGTGGTVAVATSTVSVHIPVGRVKVSILSLAIDALVAAAGSGAITVQVFAVKGGSATAITAATSLKNDVVTAAGNFALAITSTYFDGAGNATRVIDGTSGDFIRVDIVAAGTVTTQPQCMIVAELAVKE